MQIFAAASVFAMHIAHSHQVLQLAAVCVIVELLSPLSAESNRFLPSAFRRLRPTPTSANLFARARQAHLVLPDALVFSYRWLPPPTFSRMLIYQSKYWGTSSTNITPFAVNFPETKTESIKLIMIRKRSLMNQIYIRKGLTTDLCIDRFVSNQIRHDTNLIQIHTRELRAFKKSSEMSFMTTAVGGKRVISDLATRLLPDPPCRHRPSIIWVARLSKFSNGSLDIKFTMIRLLSSSTSGCFSDDNKVRNSDSKCGCTKNKFSVDLSISSMVHIAFDRRRQSYIRKWKNQQTCALVHFIQGGRKKCFTNSIEKNEGKINNIALLLFIFECFF